MRKNIEEKNKGKEILELLQEKYELNSAQDLSFALKDLFKDALQKMMNAEFDTAMGYSKYDKTTEKNNYRNGSTKKTLKSEFGEFEFETPRDRNGEFEPKIVPKNKKDVSGIEDKIISLYGRGLTTREINEQIQDLYGIDVSATMVSNITDQIIPDIKEWQGRPLDDVYPIVFIDAVHFSVREDSRVVKKAAYIVLGINQDGYKEIIGIYIGENESSKFWLGVLNDLKQRSVKDILIMYIPATIISLIYPVYLQVVFNNWHLFIDSQYMYWDRISSNIFLVIIMDIKYVIKFPDFGNCLYFVVNYMFLGLMIYLIYKDIVKNKKLTINSIYMILSILAIFSSCRDGYNIPSTSFYRYFLGCYPIYLIGSEENDKVYNAILYVFILLFLMCSMLFVSNVFFC